MEFRHKKRGSTYRILSSTARFQWSGNEALEHALDNVLLTLYQDVATGNCYVRPTAEFLDGRFEPVEPVPPGYQGPIKTGELYWWEKDNPKAWCLLEVVNHDASTVWAKCIRGNGDTERIYGHDLSRFREAVTPVKDGELQSV